MLGSHDRAPSPPQFPMVKPRYIAVEGPIGVGKSELASRLADAMGGRLMLEPVENNPFLEKFYDNRAKMAFQTQIFFLFERYQQQRDLLQQDLFSGFTVSDYLFAKDRVFAFLNLDQDELHLYEQIYALLDQQLPTPDLVIYLQAPTHVLKDRIRKRKRDFERGITDEYLENLITAYNRFFFNYSASPLLVVNTADIDFVARESDFNQLLEKIRHSKKGVEYFVPRAK